MKAKEEFNKVKEKIEGNYLKISDRLKGILGKDTHVFIKLVCLFVVACAFSILYEYKYCVRRYGYDSKVRMIMVAGIVFFIGLHFIFSISKMYSFIHKYRYLIACAFLIFVMIFKLSGSSIINYQNFIQPEIGGRKYAPIFGTPRMIRTDEWATSTTYILSQAESETPFSYFSDVLRGTDTDMYTVSNAPVWDVMILGRPFQIGFLLFGNNVGLSFYWYIRLVAMMLGSYELCLILTKKNRKASLLGMLMITFSSATQWWYCMDTLIWGQIAVVLFDKLMKADKKWKKYIVALGLVVSGLSYIFVFYPAWQLPFGYVFLAIVIWMLFENIKYGSYKINKHDIVVLCVVLVCIVTILGRWYSMSKGTLELEMNTDYPGERQELGGHAQNIYSYFYDIFFASREYLNPCEYSAMLSFFPLPLILGIIYVIRNKRDLHFWIPIIIVTVFLGIWCIWGFPAFLANVTKLSMSPSGRTTIPLGTACIYMIVYLVGNFDSQRDKLLEKKIAIPLAAIFTAFIAYMAWKTLPLNDEIKYLNKKNMLIAGSLFFIASLGITNINNRVFKNAGGIAIIIIALMSGLTVNPVISTTNIFYEKPFSKKINEIQDQDPEALWAFNDDGWYCNDYALASGIKVINSTQVYPNFELYEKLFGKEKLEDPEFRTKVNRYCHINFEISNEDTDVDLLYPDNIALIVNYKDIEKLGIKYIITFDDMPLDVYGDNFKELYDEEGIMIYEYVPMAASSAEGAK